MVDATEATESEFITAELINNSKTKVIVPTGAGEFKEKEFNGVKSVRLQIPVQIDGKNKTFCPNKDSAKNLIRAFGSETLDWVGQKIKCKVTTLQGKDAVMVEV